MNKVTAWHIAYDIGSVVLTLDDNDYDKEAATAYNFCKFLPEMEPVGLCQ